MLTLRTLCGAALAVLSLHPLTAIAADPALPALHADPALVSVSGLSSGGFMAAQYAVAFSAGIKGAGIVAGGPYDCTDANLGGITTCMSGKPKAQASYDKAVDFAKRGKIDSLDHLVSSKVYLFSGTKDKTVYPAVVDAVRDFYALAGLPPANLVYVNDYPAGHAFLSPSFGNDCPTSQSPFINQCTVLGGTSRYDQPQAILSHIYGALQPQAATLSSQPEPFDQSEFGRQSGLDETGYVYIPQTCRAADAKCAVHVVFHGCKQNAATVGNDVYAKVGYNPWADTNGVIVLYPQVKAAVMQGNPNGCWDWWGYTGADFPLKSGPQMTAINAMITRLTQK